MNHPSPSNSSISTSIAVVVLIIIVVAAASGIILLQLSSTGKTGATTSAKSVSFMTDVCCRGYHGLFFYGYYHQFYTQNGLSVSVLPGSGSPGTITAVATGKATFGFVDTGTLAKTEMTSNVSNIRIIAMILPVNFLCIIYNKAVIHSISDLNGKTGASSGPAIGPQALFPVIATDNGINPSSIKWTYGTVSTYESTLALGKVDFILTTVNQLANIQPVASQNGIQLGVFPYSQYGLNIYGSALITTTQMIANQPAIVQKFVNATLWSVIEAVHNPLAAIQSADQYSATVNSTGTALADFELTVNSSMPKVNSTVYSNNPLTWGWIDSATMQQTINTVARGYNITTPMDASQIFTDQFTANPST